MGYTLLYIWVTPNKTVYHSHTLTYAWKQPKLFFFFLTRLKTCVLLLCIKTFWNWGIDLILIMDTDLFLEPTSRGHHRNCSLWHLIIGFIFQPFVWSLPIPLSQVNLGLIFSKNLVPELSRLFQMFWPTCSSVLLVVCSYNVCCEKTELWLL